MCLALTIEKSDTTASEKGVFDIDSEEEEEKKVPARDAGRDVRVDERCRIVHAGTGNAGEFVSGGFCEFYASYSSCEFYELYGEGSDRGRREHAGHNHARTGH